MGTRKIEHNGKKLTVAEWSRETGLAAGTIQERLKNGWEVSTALTAIPDSNPLTTSSPLVNQGAGRQLKDSFLALALASYKRNQKVCEEALDAAFQADPLKTMKDLAIYLPKDAIERAVNNQEKAIVRIELMQTPKQLEYVDVATVKTHSG
jgi:nitrogen fixation protein